MSHLRDAYGKNSSNSARSMSNILGVWIQISGFCRGITTNNNTKNPLSPERQNSPQFGVRLPAKPRNAGSIAFFQIAGVFFIKGGIFFKGGLFFFRRRFPRHAATIPPAGRTCIFFSRRGGKRFPRGTGRQGVRTRGGRIFFFEGNTHTATIPARQSPPFAKKFRASERIGYQGTAIFAQPPRPLPDERARRRATRSPSDRIRRTRRSRPTVRTPAVRRVRTSPVRCRRTRLSVQSVRAPARRTAYARPSEPAICQIRKCFRRITC